MSIMYVIGVFKGISRLLASNIACCAVKGKIHFFCHTEGATK